MPNDFPQAPSQFYGDLQNRKDMEAAVPIKSPESSAQSQPQQSSIQMESFQEEPFVDVSTTPRWLMEDMYRYARLAAYANELGDDTLIELAERQGEVVKRKLENFRGRRF